MAELRVEPVMGTVVRIEVRGRTAGDRVMNSVLAWLHEVDARFSPYRSDSEVRRLDRGELRLADAHRDVRFVLERCAALRRATGGWFDVRATGRLDPSGFVKGWAVDRAAALLVEAGVTDFCVGAGGDLRLCGGPWRVGLQHPAHRDRLAGVLELGDAAVATSGGYERGGHVRDPRSRRPAAGALSVTVVGAELASADAFATAALAMGAAAPAWLASLPGHEAMVVLPGERVLATGGFSRLCAGGRSVAASLAATGCSASGEG